MKSIGYIMSLMLLLPFIGLGQSVMVVTNPDEVIPVRNFEYYIDSINTLGIDDVASKKFKQRKEAISSELQNVYSTWVRFSLSKESNVEENLAIFIDQANIDIIELYQKDASQKWLKTQYGNNIPFSKRKYKTNHFIFDIASPSPEGYLYLNVKNNVTTSYNILVGSKTAVLNHELNGSTLFAILMGVFLVMIAYNFFLYISIKETVYLVYVIQSIITALLQTVLYGFSFQYLWPNSVYFQEYGSEFLTTLGTIAGLIFMNLFLKTKYHVPALNLVSKIFIALYAILAIYVWFDVTLVNAILLILQSVIAIFILFVAISVYLKGYRPAKFYLLAWSMFLLGIMIFVMAETGIIERNNYTTLTITIGSAIEVVLLSFALANRINLLKKQEELAVNNSLRLEREKATLVREQNVSLEQKVIDRTHALEETNIKLSENNKELEEAYSNLKNTQSQLVNAEKMSSLGQLTAGIAHEINNPINFVSSNINPLKRDVEDVIQLFEKTDEMAKKCFSEEDYEIIADLKEEIDYTYVKSEIDQLLDGMHDGASRTVEIIRGLKLFSRVDEDDLKRVNLEEGINSTLILLNSSLKHEVTVEKNFGNIPAVECFGGKMNQVFMNIISNAGQALKADDSIEDARVTISTQQVGDEVVLKFADNGPGMTDDVKQKLFEPFFTTKPVGQGTGLGLSIVYKIIDKINGTIVVNSELGKGTEFVITLPITNTNKPPNNE